MLLVFKMSLPGLKQLSLSMILDNLIVFAPRGFALVWYLNCGRGCVCLYLFMSTHTSFLNHPLSLFPPSYFMQPFLSLV